MSERRKHPHRPFSGPDLCSLDAHEVVDLLKERKVSAREVVDAAFERIAAVEPVVNAMPTLCVDRAYKAADAVDTEQADHPGWLAGLPVSIKDLTEVAGVRTTFGTPGLADYVPDFSDPLVEQLERRGGIVAGKTNTPEMGAGANTFNPVLGVTRNAHDTSMNAAGSSGGAAVSLATGEMWLSQGSDHGGSLRTPAAYNGIVGMRPSPGLCASQSATGWITEGQSGPMARNVRDCALFLDAMVGFQHGIPSSFPPPCEGSYQQAVKEADERVRIAFAPDLGGFSPVEPVIDHATRAALSAVERAGGHVEEACPDLTGLDRTYRVLRGMGSATGYRRMPEHITSQFKQTIKDDIAFGRALTMDDVAEAHLTRTDLFRNMADLLTRFDVLACPTVGNMPRPVEVEWVDEINGRKLTNYVDWLRFAFLATTTGLPAISVPIGFSDTGMPIGIQLIGPPRGEARLLAVARAVEMAVGGPFGPVDPNVTHM